MFILLILRKDTVPFPTDYGKNLNIKSKGLSSKEIKLKHFCVSMFTGEFF